MLVALTHAGAAENRAWPWLKGRPEGVGVSHPKLDAARAVSAPNRMHTFLVLRDDRLIYEWHAANAAGAEASAAGFASEALLKPFAEGAPQSVAALQERLAATMGTSVGNWRGERYSAHMLIGLGRLLVHEGDWEGRTVLSRAALSSALATFASGENQNAIWRSNAQARYPALPADALWASDPRGNVLLVVPSERFVAVRLGDASSPEAARPDAIRRSFLEPVFGAIILSGMPVDPEPPYPKSKFITNLHWAPKDQIIRRAEGGDNWPITWADDDALYTAFGDGNGFKPFVPEKLSLGICVVTGMPPDFKGVNLRSPTAESTGHDIQARKASGMLMVDGVLYMLARNAGNSQVAWSKDHGRTWTWADWTFTTSFGCPTFLNFGKNYAGARDHYVYVYSNDHDSAYEASDHMVLARVPRDRITERAAYEFFRGLDAAGQPQWTTDINQRGAVFTAKGRCYRSGITYNAALKRYLWCQIIPASKHKWGPRFQGGFGIYEAPEPWGPWSTVFYTTDWDTGPGESSSLPTKWMSEDGKTVHLVFSGDDSFSVRRATLEIAD